MLTDLGKMVKKLMVDEGISQGQLAKDLGISPAMLSNYMTGKNIPEMEIAGKCVKRFNLKDGKIRDIFAKVFSSTAKANRKIILDTRFFKEKRIDLLVQAIVMLMICPDDLIEKLQVFDDIYHDLGHQISGCFKTLEYKAEYQLPVLTENDISS